MADIKAEQFKDEVSVARQTANLKTPASAAVDMVEDKIKKQAGRQVLVWAGGILAAILPWVLLILFILIITIGVYNEYFS